MLSSLVGLVGGVCFGLVAKGDTLSRGIPKPLLAAPNR